MVDVAKPLVTITGVTGFVGSRVCLDFLKSGEYRIRGTVRDTKNEAKLAPLRKAYGEYFDQLELVEADLLDAESWKPAIAGSTYVVHTASPFFFPRNEDDVIKPAVEGTKAVMNACAVSSVKKCVITSGLASIKYMASKDKPDLETGFYDETCWSNPERPEGMAGFAKAKTQAERAAWDFQKSLTSDKRFDIVTICPAFVMGPTLIPGGFTSANFMLSHFNGSKSRVATTSMSVVDVRDVSKIHLEAVRRPDVANQRFIAYS
jgi:nucleoside-diphosphate-sugar epimerase